MPPEIKLFSTGCTDEEIGAASRVLASGSLVMGRHGPLLEEELENYLGASRGSVVTCASGTDALVLALEAIAAKAKGSECRSLRKVLVPAMTFSATAEAVLRAGLEPVVVDVDPGHATLTERAVRDILVREWDVGAVVLVHLYGWQAAEAEGIARACAEHGALLIEDCAQAFGAGMYRDDGMDTHHHEGMGYGDAAAFSFYPTKPLGGAGDGGAAVFRGGELADYARMRRNHGRDSGGKQLIAGYNSRLDEVSAAVLRLRLSEYAENLRKRRAAAELYKQLLPQSIQFSFEWNYPAPYVFPVMVPSQRRNKIREGLSVAGIQTGVHYSPAVSGLTHFSTDCPVADELATMQMSLPCHHRLTEEDVRYVCAALEKIL